MDKPRYEIVVLRNNDNGFEQGYIGPWSCYREPTFYDDLLDALELLDEWGYNQKHEPLKRNRPAIYDTQDDSIITTETSTAILKILRRRS